MSIGRSSHLSLLSRDACVTDLLICSNLNVCRDDDWGAQYSFVPSNTLLEPNNVIPSWEFGDEENKEVSATLRRIRQKYDNIHKTVLAKEKELERKKVSLSQCFSSFQY